MATLPFVFILASLNFFVSCEVQVENNPDPLGAHSAEIAAVLTHLNSSSFRVYDYEEATLLHAQTKADITELTLDVNVECLHNYPVPCAAKVLTCHAFVRSAPGAASQVLNDVNCKPRPEIVVEEAAHEPAAEPTAAEINETKSIALSNEAVSSEVNEPFVAVRKTLAPCVGCPFDLNPNAEGVDELVDLALEHVGSERPHKQALVRVLKLQQQVVSGVKYTLIVELGPTVCAKDSPQDLTSCPMDSNAASSVCEITYLQKPWISRAKHIINNNCTTSQEYVKSDTKKTEMSNEIDMTDPNRRAPASTPNFDHFAESGTLEEMSPPRLGDLESQIVLDVEESSPRRDAVEVVQSDDADAAAPSTVLTQTQIAPKVESVDPTPELQTELPETTTPTQKPDSSGESSESVESKSNKPKSSEESAESAEAATVSEPKQGSRKKRAIPQLEKISPEEKPLVKNLADFAAAALDNIDDDNHKRIILQILGAKKMVGDDGVYYHLIMRMGVSRCLEDKPANPYENCREKLFENYTKICKVQVFVNDDFGSPKVVKSQCQNIKRDKNDSNRTNYSRFKRDNLKGAPKTIDKDSEIVTELVKEGIDHLNLKRTVNKHKFVEVVSATSQLVAGTLYRFQAKIVETDCPFNGEKQLKECEIRAGAQPKRCKINIWEKPWEEFKQFTIKCDDDDEEYTITTVIIRRKRDKNDAERTDYSKVKRDTITGAPGTIDKNSDVVTKLLKEGINHLNGRRTINKHKSVEVVSATSQVVAGSLYRIRTKIAETECPANDQKKLEDCNVRAGAKPDECLIKVWEKSWENFKQFTIKCDSDDQEYRITTTSDRRKRHSRDEDDSARTDYSRIKRDGDVAFGAPATIDKDGDVVTKLLKEGVNHLNGQRTVNKHKSVEVISATSQVVAGFAYRIRTKVAETECPANDQRQLEDCKVRAGAKPEECQIDVWEKSWENFKQFTIKCDSDDQEYKIKTTSDRRKRDKNDGERTDYSRFKRQTLVGGETTIDKNGEKVTKLLNEGINHLNGKRTVNKHKSVEVISATSQVVAGALYRIRTKIAETECPANDQRQVGECNVRAGAKPEECQIKVWEKSWENFKEFTIKCDSDDQEYKITTTSNRRKRDTNDSERTDYSRSKRHTAVGGEGTIDKNGKTVTKLLNEGINHLNGKRTVNKHKSVEVISATSQVVAGALYRIRTKIAETECPANDQRQLGDCNVRAGAKPKECQIEVWEKPWENFKEFTIKCDSDDQEYKITTTSNRRKRDTNDGERSDYSRSKRDTVAGGVGTIDKNGEKVTKLLNEGINHLNGKRTVNKHKSVEVISATSQVVAGALYRIRTKIAETECPANDQRQLGDCNVRAGAKPKECRIEVWEKPWENFKEFTIKCDSDDQEYKITTTSNRRKRQTDGALSGRVSKHPSKADKPHESDIRSLHFAMFNDFIKKHDKKYTKKEFKHRLKVFGENMLRIRVLNTYEQGDATYGVTQFADLTPKEFSARLGLRPDLRDENAAPLAEAEIPDIDIPTEFDWRQKKAVTAVKNQQQCGSCWAFSVTGNVEGQYALKHGDLMEFSEQELVDCDTEDQGCNGGLMDTAYRQIEKLGGLESERDYPYDAEDEKCHFNRSLARVQLSGAVNISQDEGEMAKWLVANGPISIAINANAMQFYFGGVSHPFKFLCSPKNLDHGVLIVGYGVHTYPLFNKTLPYWIVKNSWGPGWGEQGYYRVYRGDGTCGLNQTPSSAIVV